MPSNKETLVQDHICAFPENGHKYIPLSKTDFTDKEYHIIEKHLVSFIIATQADKYETIKENIILTNVCRDYFAKLVCDISKINAIAFSDKL